MVYSHIARFYGKQFNPGDRVQFTEYNNKPGTVRRVRGDPQYVSVKFDDGKIGDCHPDSLIPMQGATQ